VSNQSARLAAQIAAHFGASQLSFRTHLVILLGCLVSTTLFCANGLAQNTFLSTESTEQSYGSQCDDCWRISLTDANRGGECYAKRLTREPDCADCWFVKGMVAERWASLSEALLLYLEGQRHCAGDVRFRKAIAYIRFRILNNGQEINFDYSGYRRKDAGRQHDAPDPNNVSNQLILSRMKKLGLVPILEGW
jgi:hypothetical protein